MKLNRIIPVLAACSVAVLCACDPIEPKSDFGKGGTPITSEELTAALEVKQLPNEEGKVEGDQYIIVKNNRPAAGGATMERRARFNLEKVTRKTYTQDYGKRHILWKLSPKYWVTPVTLNGMRDCMISMWRTSIWINGQPRRAVSLQRETMATNIPWH